MGSYANETVSRAEVSVVCFKQEDLQAIGGVDITDAGNIPVNEVLTIGKNEGSYIPGLLTPIQFILWTRNINFFELKVSFFILDDKIQCNCSMI